jgi:hypothetical protein
LHVVCVSFVVVSLDHAWEVLSVCLVLSMTPPMCGTSPQSHSVHIKPQCTQLKRDTGYAPGARIADTVFLRAVQSWDLGHNLGAQVERLDPSV